MVQLGDILPDVVGGRGEVVDALGAHVGDRSQSEDDCDRSQE